MFLSRSESERHMAAGGRPDIADLDLASCYLASTIGTIEGLEGSGKAL